MGGGGVLGIKPRPYTHEARTVVLGHPQPWTRFLVISAFPKHSTFFHSSFFVFITVCDVCVNAGAHVWRSEDSLRRLVLRVSHLLWRPGDRRNNLCVAVI